MKHLTTRIALIWMLFCLIPTGVNAQQTLIPGGQVIGLELTGGSLTIADFEGDNAPNAGLQVGDRITHIDQTPIRSVDDVHNALNQAKGAVSIRFLRNGKENTVSMTPNITKDGPRLGIYLKQGITGVGTVTWYDPDSGKFGALGHCVNDSSGNLLPLTEGTAYDAGVMCVKKGKTGAPGQLMGSIDPSHLFGQLYKNTQQGVFGITASVPESPALPTAERDEIKVGDAVIRSTVSGNTVQEYSVKILKIYPTGRSEGRNMLLKITDQRLLDTTGGIVQGMSGSPIIQDGKLVGAVTHVLVNDPTTGYGIFIENMLDAAA